MEVEKLFAIKSRLRKVGVLVAVIAIASVAWVAVPQFRPGIAQQPPPQVTGTNASGAAFRIIQSCLVTAVNQTDGWVEIQVTASESDGGAGSAAAIVTATATYTPHTPSGTHLPVQQQVSLFTASASTSDPSGGPVSVTATGSGSLSLPSHEDTDHVHLVTIQIISLVTTEFQVAVPSCKG